MAARPRTLDLSSLQSAVTALAGALAVVRSPAFAELDTAWRDTLIAGVVQHFEFTFELSWKMLKRALADELVTPSELDGLAYRDLFRLGQAHGLLSDVEAWFEFRELRNITAHTYRRDKALAVAERGPALLEHATALLHALEARNHG